ncbi:MAG: dual-specificity RNA methyltransferase RlmN [Planctomycetota bacterium]
MPETVHFFDLSPPQLEHHCTTLGLPRYAADQLRRWVYERGVVDTHAMTDISRAGRDRIAATVRFDEGVVLEHQQATDGTQKLLLGWPEGVSNDDPLKVVGRGERQTECVMIPTDRRRTACISSQVGCPVGCRFCASGLDGLEGNLTTGRIVEQVHRLQRLEGVDRVTNVVFMGMGEPLANYQNVERAIRTINASWGLAIGARKITVSTVGLPAAIRRLVSFDIPVTLALSLHAPNDEIRRQLIPWADYVKIEELLDACGEYFQRTGREITLEYILIRGVNDRPEHARELVDVARGLRANVNLIRYNEVRGLPYDRPTTEDVRAFQEVLRDARINVHIRASRGRDIAAACGQLRHERADSSG